MTARPWQTRLSDFAAYLRRCGWRQPIIMRGQRVSVVGIACPRQTARRHSNDNGKM